MTNYTDLPLAQSRSGSFVGRFIQDTIAAMEAIPYWLIALIARFAIAGVFWRSGQTKVDGWQIWQPNSDAFTLFQQEYKLPVIDPNIAAYLATWAEHLFPLLLVIGLATRYAALSLLVMTLVIEIFVYPFAWPTHGTWATCFLLLMWRGAGAVSLDHLIAQRYR
jgi:putative oxidoreductase